MIGKEQLSKDADAHPKVWEEGYKARIANRSASACPYMDWDEHYPAKMNVWLSGHVTASYDIEGKSA